MGYDVAINKAWADIAQLKPTQKLTIKFLADTYDIDLEGRKVLSLSCNAAAKDFSAILILHYLAQKIKGLPALSGEWLTFRELSGIEGYYPAFKKRSIEPIIRKYGNNPIGLLSVLDRLPAKQVKEGDVGIILEAFEGVPVLVKLYKGDEEFGLDAKMLFDRSIMQIFCTEDIVVLSGFVAYSL